MKCGLLGRKLSHSYSPQIHSFFGKYSYRLFEKEPEEIEAFLQNEDFSGINVTIPYKKAVIPYCHILTETAKAMGAVNTIIRKDGKLIGHNTDYFGFSSMIKRSGLLPKGKKVLVLGSGGASVTAQAVLSQLGAKVIVISRSGENNYYNLSQHSDAAIIVNCTPVGMYPHTEESPLSLDLFPQLEGVLDMIYNPAHTLLLQQAKKRGLVAENGLWMLVAQAWESAQWFLDAPLKEELIRTVHKKLSVQMRNIILIGMPGSGKTTIAQILAQKTGRPLTDADTELENRSGHKIPEIFANQGEDAFRSLETQVLRELGKASGIILSTGGGCVTREDNQALLEQNGIIFWIQRDLSLLATEGRPLSQRTKAEDMYRVREPLYRAFAHYTVENNTTPENAAEQILAFLR